MSVDPDLKELIRLTGELGVVELRVEHAGLHIHIRRQPTSGAVELAQLVETPAAPPEPAEAVVRSPLVGRFYWSADGEGATALAVGQPIKAGQRVGFVETMHVMNEVVADASGEIVEVLVEAGQPVEYGQPLLRVRLDARV